MLLSVNSIQPWNSPLPTLLLEKCKTLNDVNQIHGRLITTGSIRNASLTAKIILAFSSSASEPRVEFARHLFFTRHASRIQRKHGDPFLWNAILKSFSHGRDPEGALLVFCFMIENGAFVDGFSLSLVLKACSQLGFLKEGMQIHGFLRKTEIWSDLFLQNSLVSLYMHCGCIGFARQVFDKMEKRDSVSYNLMIHGYVERGMVHLAYKLFDCMPEEQKNLVSWNTMISGYVGLEGGLKVAFDLFEKMPERDLISWNTMIDGCVKCGEMEYAQQLFDKMTLRDVVSWSNMVHGYAKVGRIKAARTLFDKIPEKDVVACNAMMAGYLQNGNCAEALQIFHNMQHETNLSPDNATLLSVLSAVAQIGHLDEGVAVHSYIQKNKLSLSGNLGTALIDMYSKCGSIKKATYVFENIEEKSVDHWNAMIGGLAIHGLGELAFDLLMEMERLSVKPDDITFIGVLNACGHAGLVKEGMMCFEIMRNVHKLEPKLQHYGCMVDILSRAGRIKEATNFIVEMPIEPNDVIWNTLLCACSNYKSLNIGETVAELLSRMDSHNSSSYVLLSNMYAGFGMWDDVRRLRMLMKKRNLKKIPGCSWIQLEGIVHEFYVQDKSHPQVMEIYSLLDSF
ncbi:pentatricopeptide repeat-containing protein At2g45350, chloroplastic [Tripterygium wilfordii]|uniref:pentatricopeptide repeat-containing protein At2g45350, chloroplastic n=1 Tax=Tripterygium wilfordii TaxID=458696 RepID=UPI0018F81CBE|nr:pentatricopeptide repeat-containing protein At2g45350, chloroplastic [Tripterygium wilfordii]